MGGCRCTFLNCPVNTERNPGMHFFHFPNIQKNKERFMKWVNYSNAYHILDLIPSQQKNKVLCGRHFLDMQFMNYKQDRLVGNAFPTIHKLDEVYALDYGNDPNNPVLIKVPKTTAKHLVPPEGFPNPLCLNEKDRQNCAEIVKKYTTISKTIATTNSVSPNKRSSNSEIEIVTKKSKLEPNNTINLTANDIAFENTKVKTEVVECISDNDNEITHECSENGEVVEAVTKSNSQSIKCVKNSEKQHKTTELQQFHNTTDSVVLQKKIKPEKEHLESQEILLTEQLNEMKELLLNESKELELSETKFMLLKKEAQQLKVQIKNLKDSKLNYEIQIESKNKQHEQIIKENQRLTLAYDALQKQYNELEENYNAIQEQQEQQKELLLSEKKSTVTQPQLTKPQLFNAIKKYLSQNMIALLRIQLASCNAERNWKPDERHLAVDLLNLGEQIYKHFTNEWLLRLPPLRQARTWSEEAVTIDDEEDL